MARRGRIEFTNAIYHVFNRGNFRQDIFTTNGSGLAFEEAIHDACKRYGWILHAYVIMSNHFHLALETPHANLSKGMQWLQTTFAARFCYILGERGRVFEGRYKAPLVQLGHHLTSLVDYIHLNPVRAGICKLELLHSYTLGSYSKFFASEIPAHLQRATCLSPRDLENSPAGTRQYQIWLKAKLERDHGYLEQLSQTCSQSWLIGDETFARQVRERLILETHEHGLAGSQPQELDEADWKVSLEQMLEDEGRTLADIASDRKGVAWKRRVALRLRKEAGATNVWIARTLNCRHHSYISKWLAEERRQGLSS